METLQKSELQSFHFVFQLSKKIVFEINYYRLGSNENKHFSTSASEFNQPKSDYSSCGQGQNRLLFGKAMTFYKKWDFLHIQDITKKQYDEILEDLEVLKNTYNFIETDTRCFSFSEIKELSKMNPKKTVVKAT